MDFIKTELKNIIIFVVLLVAIFFSYRYFFGSANTNETVVVTNAAGEAGGGRVGDDVLPVLLAIKNIKLDKTFFDDRAFSSLQNYGVELAPEEAGRDNPFAPLVSTVKDDTTNTIVIKAFKSN